MAEPGRDPGPPYGFAKEDANRISKAVVRDERRARNERPERAPGSNYIPIGPRPAKAGGSTIAGGTIASPTSATVTLMVPSGTGFTTTGGTSVTAYNPYTGSVAANSLLWVVSFNGNWYVVAANC